MAVHQQKSEAIVDSVSDRTNDLQSRNSLKKGTSGTSSSFAFLIGKHRTMVLTGALFVLLLIFWLDTVTNFEVGFFVFYFVPVSIAAWFIGRQVGLMMAVLAAGCWFMSDQLAHHTYSKQYLVYWETFMHLASFLTTAITITNIRLKHFKEHSLTLQLQDTVNKLQTTQARMSELMTLDTLTGIANRGYGVGQVDIEISRSTRNHSPLVLLLFNINNFRRYNEVFGHDAGDEILVAIARQFQLQLRSIDTVCRYAGDRFMVIAPGTDADGAQIVCQRIIQKTSAIFESRSDENAIPLQFSSHIVLFNVGESSDQLLYRLEHNV